jgi:hypothetical protein
MSYALDALESELASPKEASPTTERITVDGILARAESAGHSQAALALLKSQADLFRRMSTLAKVDVDAEAWEVWERLPEFRRERAGREREAATKLTDPAERKDRLGYAERLDNQARKLDSPSAEDRFKARAMVTELSIRLAARLRGIDVSTPDVEPSSLRLFERTFKDYAQGVEATGVTRAQAQNRARLAFLQAMVEADATPDDPAGLRTAIVRYRRNTTRDFGAEPGHLHDLPLSETPQALDVPTGPGEDPRNPEEAAEVSRLSRALALAAAAELNPRHYAIYRVLSENTHLFDWRLEPDGKLVFVKREGAERGENIAAAVMREVGGYAGRGAAYRAVHDTLDRLGDALHKYGRDVNIEDIPVEKRTRAMDRLTASREQVQETARNHPTPATKASPTHARQETAEIE